MDVQPWEPTYCLQPETCPAGFLPLWELSSEDTLLSAKWNHFKATLYLLLFFRKNIAFWCRSILKSLLNLLQHCFCFMLWFFWPQGIWVLWLPNQGSNPHPLIGRQSPKHWTTREVPLLPFVNCLRVVFVGHFCSFHFLFCSSLVIWWLALVLCLDSFLFFVHLL